MNGIKINSQDELAALLPKNIENIEVDYLAVGEGATTKGGVIRITTKKQKDGGYSGYLGLKAGAMVAYGYNSSSPTFVFDASIGKWTFNYYAVNQHQQLIEDAKYNYLYNSGLQTNSISETRSWLNNFGNRLNISYGINDKSTLAISEYVGNITIKNKQNSVVETILGNDENPVESNAIIHGPESQFVQQTVNFTSTLGGLLNAYWETATSFENYYWQPVGNVNASLWKSFCDDKLKLSLQSTVWAKGRKSRTEGAGYTSYYHNATKPTSFTLSLTWNFSGGKKVRQRAEAESIQQYNKIEEKK